MGWIILMMILLMQWNARSLLANGQEFKKYIEELSSKPSVICSVGGNALQVMRVT